MATFCEAGFVALLFSCLLQFIGAETYCYYRYYYRKYYCYYYMESDSVGGIVAGSIALVIIIVVVSVVVRAKHRQSVVTPISSGGAHISTVNTNINTNIHVPPPPHPGYGPPQPMEGYMPHPNQPMYHGGNPAYPPGHY
ncbi:uncharacterized protein LOC128158986 [Crassostrea angulata]|uniref:uncharacterized protein LOC128158986 n=1 Tax=Magallana angulata TaxID=2784310 RepID=UPI0022B1C5C5|nr:uncharacterized protein LOC128158986 [Crassostrea angulata]